MSDYTINIILNDDKQKKIEAAGLSGSITKVGGQSVVKVPVTDKEQKKLGKGFPALAIGSDNSYSLPAEAEEKLLNIICDMKTTDVMKFAIMKLYNPLAGKAPRSAQR